MIESFLVEFFFKIVHSVGHSISGYMASRIWVGELDYDTGIIPLALLYESATVCLLSLLKYFKFLVKLV